MIAAPTLTTPRLTLRPHIAEDFDAYAALMMSDRAVHMDGPYDLFGAWRNFASDVAQWGLYGSGALAVVNSETGDVVGQVGLNRIPPYPEAELGWQLYEGYEGKGYMTEAAQAFRDWCYETQGLPSLVSYIDPANTRSIALAERLGAWRDEGAAIPESDDLDFCHVYRHPMPEVRQ
ncbi:GNAT family N-acetyltransferase [Ovoidimarina sediminis]|uniref:GNAT family N-acetyltransferase n=1 Tax=Ovoidimarina sediminis TaxID=3079856 RepID=UPI002910F970|nr:GNAT family N-acetyltransferase [Rhodophyticola sp. MJ-SS7]MDU8944798.1 GNAT family N-acetyltransferase [Rhodophyticola sp. MJ-SS7]